MDFTIENLKEGVATVARNIGYIIIDTTDNEYNMVRKLDFENYPRFHIYAKQQGRPAHGEAGNYIFSLHLDQKKPSYKSKGVHDHNGEYFGPVVEQEADRIKEILSKC